MILFSNQFSIVMGFYSATNTLPHCNCHITVQFILLDLHIRLRIDFVFKAMQGFVWFTPVNRYLI